MKYVMTCFEADMQTNTFMAAFDVRPSYKWYIAKVNVKFDATTAPDEAFFHKMIEDSKAKRDELGFWIPAIGFEKNLFVDPDVRELSDGQKILFVGAT